MRGVVLNERDPQIEQRALTLTCRRTKQVPPIGPEALRLLNGEDLVVLIKVAAAVVTGLDGWISSLYQLHFETCYPLPDPYERAVAKINEAEALRDEWVAFGNMIYDHAGRLAGWVGMDAG